MVRVRFIGWSSQSAAAMAAAKPFSTLEVRDARRISPLFSCSVPSKPAGFRLPG